jgi:hypothetical protein
MRGGLTVGLIVLLPFGCSSSSPPATDLQIAPDRTPAREPIPERNAARDAARELTTDAPPGACPSFEAPVAICTLQSDQITEASGLIASRRNTDVFWAHNDSGDTARVFAFNRQGQHLGVYTLQGVNAVDWEDMASGPGPVAGTQYLYLADIGDNAGSRAGIAVYRVAEPVVSSSQAPAAVALSPVDKLALQYPDGAHNAETLLVDPTDGDLYVVAKSADGISGVYRSAAPHDATGTRTLTKVTTLVFGSGPLASTGPLATGGDISPGGEEIIIRTYGAAVLWPRAPGLSIAAALGGSPCLLKVASEPQGESISFDAQRSYYTTSEGAHPSLFFFARK